MSEERDQIVSALRDMLRVDFGLGQELDLCIAKAVQIWYLSQYPLLKLHADQPDLEAIIAKVRAKTTTKETTP